jgi:hypothetical protein
LLDEQDKYKQKRVEEMKKDKEKMKVGVPNEVRRILMYYYYDVKFII